MLNNLAYDFGKFSRLAETFAFKMFASDNVSIHRVQYNTHDRDSLIDHARICCLINCACAVLEVPL